MRETRVRAISISASFRSSGGSARDLSLMTSTAVPPRPNTITGPKVGSSAMPAISSRAFGRRTIACTVTPVTRAPGFSRSARSKMSRVAWRTASSLVRSSFTPPTSDLWTMSGERILTATVPPSARIGRAAAAASSGGLGEGHGRDRDVVGAQQRG